jgi:hypothetical protein
MINMGYNKSARAAIRSYNKSCSAKGKVCTFGEWSKSFTKSRKLSPDKRNWWVTKTKFRVCKVCKSREFNSDYLTIPKR